MVLAQNGQEKKYGWEVNVIQEKVIKDLVKVEGDSNVWNLCQNFNSS